MPAALDDLESPLEFAEVMARDVERLSQGSQRDESHLEYLIPIVFGIRAGSRKLRESFTGLLRRGMLCPPEVTQLATTGERLAASATRIRRLAETPGLPSQTPLPSKKTAELAVEMVDLANEFTESSRLIKDFVAAATAPRRPLPPDRVRQVREAYARGETKRLEKTNGAEQ